ncbi:MAG: hypothetical protein IJP14_02070 [Clostridia bacterium]|nr:hypothetical protein [Clostridia bacterium]
MRNWLQTLSYRFQTFMYGRYGVDLLSKHLNIASLIVLILSWFIPELYLLALALLVWSTFRIYSRNIYNRQQELFRYQNFIAKLRRRLNLLKSRFRDRKTHRFYRCPGCREFLRVPKGRGEVHITCPRCRHEIVRKT